MAFDRSKTLTIYGRKPLLEVLENPNIHISTVHLSESNKPSGDIKRIKQLAKQRDALIKTHSKLALSRISKNGKQDQGVAADIHCDNFYEASELLNKSGLFISVDRIGNPQNLGMLIRSIAASGIGGLLLSEESGNTALSSLVIKASAGTVFKCPIYRTKNLIETVTQLKQQGFEIMCLAANASTTLANWQSPPKTLAILGNETDGVSDELLALADSHCAITMHNGVESLNVAVAGSLVAFAAGAPQPSV